MSEHVKQQLGKLIQQIKELAAVYHGAAAQAKISVNELWIWYTLLVMEGDFSQQDISDMWSLPKQTVNSIIANLVKKGYLILEAVPGTRNRKVIRITEAGKEYGDRLVMPIYQAEQRSLELMTEEERLGCITLLGKYIAIFTEEISEFSQDNRGAED